MPESCKRLPSRPRPRFENNLNNDSRLTCRPARHLLARQPGPSAIPRDHPGGLAGPAAAPSAIRGQAGSGAITLRSSGPYSASTGTRPQGRDRLYAVSALNLHHVRAAKKMLHVFPRIICIGRERQVILGVPHSKLKSRSAAEGKREYANVELFSETRGNSPPRQDGPTGRQKHRPWAGYSRRAESPGRARERSTEYRVPSNQVAGRVRTEYARQNRSAGLGQDRIVGQVGTKEVEIGTRPARTGTEAGINGTKSGRRGTGFRRFCVESRNTPEGV